MIEVRFQRGIHLPECDLWLDPWDAKPRAFVSHGHADHFARHDQVLCSETTAAIVRARFSIAAARLDPLPFQVPREIDGFRIRLLHAGHAFGSAMIHVTRSRDNATLLYTGDFKTRRARIAEPVMFVAADTLILETTYGLPAYTFPPQMEIEAAVLRFCHDAFTDGETPVLCGYSFGKAQEAIALLAEHGIPTVLHPTVAEITRTCREIGAPLPDPPVLEESTPVPAGHAVIIPPNALRSRLVRRLPGTRTAMLSGWALQSGANYRYRVDQVIPMSDHADHPGLHECIQRVRPRRILTVHGYAREFAAELRGRGKDAWCAAGGDQLEIASIVAPNQPPTHSRPHTTTTPRQSRPICPLADFSDTCRLVGETSSRLAKIDHLAHYLASLESTDDLRHAAFWLSGEALPRDAGRRPLHTGTATLRRALIRIPGCREERYRDISTSQNDAARTARLVLQELPLKPEPLDLPGLHRFFLTLAQASGSIARIEQLADRLQSLHPVESETLVKLLTGDLRIGLRDGLVEEAVAAAFNADPTAVRQAHMLTGNIGETAVLARENRLHEATLRPFVPVKCMLASPVEGTSASFPKAEDTSASPPKAEDSSFAPLPFPTPHWLEPKYDGIRAQLHKSGDRAALFSRDLRPLDAEFPELIRAAIHIPGDFILDGELIAHADGRKLGFADLQKRLGRKTADGDLFLASGNGTATIPLRYIAFDILWQNDTDLTPLPLTQRRAALENLTLAPPFELIPLHTSHNETATQAAINPAIRDGHEGLIAKDPASPYSPGRRGRAWLKLKGVMPTLDCVVTIAQQGHGKRSHVLSDYTFAVRDDATGALRVLGKAYSGLTDDEIEELTEQFQRHTLRKERRKHHVEPNVVLEIAFDSIRRSPRHDSGLALRFPRIKSIRRDKSIHDIDTLQTAQTLL